MPSVSSAPNAFGFHAHLRFFDQDADEKISLWETQMGLERIGLGRLIAWPATAFIHLGVAGLGIVRGQWQNPLQLSVPRASVLRHPDTGLLDENAEFDSARLDRVFERYGQRYAGEALTLPELLHMTSERLREGSHGLGDAWLFPGGVAGTWVEWLALLWVAGVPREGARVLQKQAVLRFYTDPQFFDEVASRLEELRERRARTPHGRLRNFMQRWLA